MATLPVGISLKCYKPNGQLRFDYSREQDLKLVTTDEINCGYADASFELCDYYNKLPLFGDRIVVMDEGRNKTCWVGEPTDITKDVGVKATIKCLGYGKTCALDLPYDHGNYVIPANPSNVSNPAGSKQVYDAGTSYATIIGDTMTRTQNIFMGSIVDLTGITLPEDSRDYIGLAPAQIWNELVILTGILATPLMWFVRGDTTGGSLPSLYMRYMGGTARLFTTWDNKTVKVTNDSYEKGTYINGCTVAYGSGLQYNFPDDVPQARDHSVLPANHDRDKFVNANNNIKSTAQAQALAEAYVARFGGPLASTNCTITICNGMVRAVPNVVPVITDNYPIWLIVSGLFINVAGMPSGDAPYNNPIKFIVQAKMDYTKGELTLSCGELQSEAQSIALMETYLTSRPYQVSNTGQPSAPYVDQDTTPAYGPPSPGSAPAQNDQSQGVAKFINNKTFPDAAANPANPLELKWDAAVDPRILPDYGVKGNFGREADSLGIKGFIDVIPCKVLNWDLCFTPPAGSNIVPTQSLTVELYEEYPPVNLFKTITVSNKQCDTGTMSVGAEQHVFTYGGKIGIKVTNITGLYGNNLSGSGFQIAIGAKKLYPDLGVNA